MVEVTCEKCGAQHRLDDADVPPSGKVITCTGCGRPITVVNPFMSTEGIVRRPTVGGFGPNIVPGLTSRLTGGPALAAFDSDPALSGGTGDVIDLGEPLAFADLPAPKRRSPLAGVVGEGRKDVRTSPLDIADLPAPKRPPPIPGRRNGIVDLPAPRRAPMSIPDLPAPVGARGGARDIDNLPAPKGPSGISHLSRPRAGDIPDLPAPKRASAIPSLPAKSGGFGDDFPDLLEPKRASSAIPSPPTKSGGFGDDFPDLLTPKRGADIPDLLTPKRGADIPDLLTPKRGADIPDLLTPKRGADIPDLLTPKRGDGGPDLLTPKHGDGGPDLLTPKHGDGGPDLLTPKRGGGGPDLPAPKGFFDDVPAPKHSAGVEAPLDLPAPKGFFDDVPAPRMAKGGGAGATNLPAPKGFFDDGLAPAHAPGPGDRKDTLDLDDLDLAPPAATGFESMSLDLAEPSMSVPLSFDDSLDLDAPSRGNIPSLEVPDEPEKAGAGDVYGGMDLPGAGAGDAGVVQFTKSTSAAPKPKPVSLDLAPVSDSLELDDEPAQITQKKATVHAGPGVADDAQTRDKPARDRKGSGKASRISARLQRIIALSVLGVVLLGGGGFFMYKRWQDQKAASKELAKGVTEARKLLHSDSPDHWDKAAAAAERTLQKNDGLEEPRGIAAQAYFAAFLDEGVEMQTRASKGAKHVLAITNKNFSGDDAQKAQALKLIIDGNPQRAVERLKDVLKKSKSDQDALLYLGWAHAALHDHKSAAEAFAKALKNSPNRKTPALFGLAEAQLAMGQVVEARESFRQVIDRNKDHVGALVGSAQAAEVGNFTERENQYLAILRRKDIEKADPRAVSRAWALAGDEALKAGRVDVARTRYEEASKIFAANLEAKVGMAKASLRQGRLDQAREVLLDVLNEDPAHLDATLTFAEAAARQGKLDEATTKVESLLSRDPPIQNPSDLARVYTVQGQILAADKTRINDAIAAYEQALAHAGDDNVQPTVALSLLLSANDRRAEGLKLLEPLEAKAAGDPVLAVTLGVAFLAAEDPVKAEGWFRKALTERPSDIEAHFQLGLALLAQGKRQDAVDVINKAYAIEAREDIGLRLAIVYEEMARDDDASAMYETLLKAENASINVTSRAGRFYSRTGNLEEAAKVGEKILAAQPGHPTGLFLTGEGLFAKNNYEGAVKVYREAVAADPTAQFLDGLGRANEMLEQFEDAVRAYEKANEQEPSYLNPLLGRARIRLARRQFDVALEVLKEAREVAPNEPMIFYMLGVCYLETGKEQNAIANLAQAIKLDNKLGIAHYRLGLAYIDAGKEREAIRALKAATANADDDSSEEGWLTDAYYKLGFVARHIDKPAALAAYQEFLSRDPKSRAEKAEANTWIMRLKAQLRR